ncbi:hypothetical protein MMC10_010561 [Thelotrema lepadinum]|nr:hypothetical protein [Thelotrema lepadinum]
MYRAAAFLSLLAAVRAQQVGTNTAETHPSITWQKCTGKQQCTTVNGKVVLDANWRWVHSTSGYTNCYTGNTWDATLCPDDTTCAANCALDGADYAGTYGITGSGNALKLNFVTQSSGKNIGSRTYLMADDSDYQMFDLLNQEFTFDVDVSNLPCGLNGALYFVEMDKDGGMAKYPTNKAGAKYGTGYCDSQCPRDIKFIAGKANSAGWQPSSSDVNAGTGTNGACCSEMDIWEANSISAAVTPHPCTGSAGLQVCSGSTCGGTDTPNSRYSSVCDPDGCDFNSYRMGDTTFYGPGKTVNTASKFTVVTQFLTADNTATGQLHEIRRFYVQNGKVIPNSMTKIPTMKTQYNSITEQYCTDQKAAFGDNTGFLTKGGLPQMGTSLARGHVLVMSLWDDHAVDMLWLDSTYPTTAAAGTPGTARGTCATSSGAPATVESQNAGASVTYSNIKFGSINSTFAAV